MKVTFQGVNKHYGKTVAVKNLDLTMKSGSLHFLLGPSGCGKTTILRMLAGLEKVTEGRIFFDERDVTSLPAADRGIGMVFQNYALWPHMKVFQNVEYGLKLRKLSKQDIKSRVDEVLSITQLSRFADRLPGQLSGGQQQRVALARALAIRPNVLLLDEPLSNLDAKLRLEMRDNISRIHRETGITTVYVTHDQKEALSMGSEISVMHAGDLIQTGTPRDLYISPKTPFIAGFIGETNLISGTVERVSLDGVVTVKTGLGSIECHRGMDEFKVGDEAKISIRPESMQISEQSSGPNQFQFLVKHTTYLGEAEQLQIEANSVVLKMNLFDLGLRLINEGETLKVRLPTKSCVALKPDQNMGAGT